MVSADQVHHSSEVDARDRRRSCALDGVCWDVATFHVTT